MLVLNGIEDVTTTVKNPQANAIYEGLHQSISNSLRVMLKAHPPMQLELLFIAYYVFHQEHGFSNVIVYDIKYSFDYRFTINTSTSTGDN